MQVLQVNIGDTAAYGGASVAAYRLHRALLRSGGDSRMLVQHKSRGDPTVLITSNRITKLLTKLSLQTKLDTDWILRFYRNRPNTQWSVNWLPSGLGRQVSQINPDIVHFHWVGRGLTSIREIGKLRMPLVWTLHDSWAFTGGCHYPYECFRYEEKCGLCPQLASNSEHDLSRRVWGLKNKAYKKPSVAVVTPSQWLGACAKASSLLRDKHIEVIPNTLDLNRYKPLDRRFAREVLALPQDKKLVLFGAVQSTSDPRKGFQYLQEAFQALERNAKFKHLFELVVFGSSDTTLERETGLPVHYLGYIHDDISLAIVYSAADVFAAPSVQDNLPNTVLEALACGVPCVTFNVGGFSDMIEHKKNGYLAQPFESKDLATGIEWVIEDAARWEDLSRLARRTVETKFSEEVIAQKHMELYESLLG